ncbi:MAG: glucose-6-phosphate isomerase [Frankiaceae bacterium]
MEAPSEVVGLGPGEGAGARAGTEAPGAPEERDVTAGGVSVRVHGAVLGAARDAVLADAADAAEGGLPAAIVAKDAGLWGSDAAALAAERLGWLDLPRTSAELVPRLAALREELRAQGIDHVVLAGMGGSSLAPEVITRAAGAELTVLDTTDPHQVRRVLADRLDRTVVVVSSKSGGTVETDSHRLAYEHAFRAAGIDPASRLIVVTDPGSPLEDAARAAGYRDVFLADPTVGGRYSALTAFGLVPSALAGADAGELLAQARALEPALGQLADNPALELGATLGGAARGGRDKLVIAVEGSEAGNFGDWAEQLIAESTGKHGRGILPVVVEGSSSPGFSDAADVVLASIGGAPPEPAGIAVSGPLGAQFLVWECATAVAGWAIGINPFDQPNVQESKDNTKALLEESGVGPLPEGEPALVDGDIAVFAPDPALLGGAHDLAAALGALLGAVPPEGYLAVMAYLDREGDAEAAGARAALAQRLGHPVTFGWAPRFLHSTGQYHKGGPQRGAFLQLTGAVTDDLEVPGRPYTFGRLQAAQALGDLRALAGRGRPVLRLHLLDRARGIAQLLAAAEKAQVVP